MSNSVVTNIKLPEEDLNELKHRAIEEKKSVNQLVREAVEMYLSRQSLPDPDEINAFEKVIGSARSGIRDGSVKHDQYLYGMLV